MLRTRDSAARDYVGLLPAAGRGARLAPFRYPKELLPIAYDNGVGVHEGVRPRAIAEFALDAIRRSNVRKCLVVIAPWKLDILNYLGDGKQLGMDIAYVCQEDAQGLACAVDLVYPWIVDRHVAFAMPDTVFWPFDAIATLQEAYARLECDLALAVFNTDEPERLGPVVIGAEHRVERVLDKPSHPPVHNTWGAAMWGPAFTEMLHAEMASGPASADRFTLGYYFDVAARRGLAVTAVEFAGSWFRDAGTAKGLEETLRSLLAGSLPCAPAGG